jgi:hypothetical protein
MILKRISRIPRNESHTGTSDWKIAVLYWCPAVYTQRSAQQIDLPNATRSASTRSGRRAC